MTMMIMEGDGELSRPELDFFLKGDMSLEPPATPNPVPGVAEKGWKDLLKLGTLTTAAAFAGLVTDVSANVPAWKAWYDLESPELEPLPLGYSERLSPFQQLLVVRCFRPDRVYNAVKRFVMGRMGEAYVQPPVLDYHRIFAQSAPATPVVFVLSPGADPQSDIQLLGQGLGFTPPTKFKFLALGQGQAAKAEEMLEQGAARGYWVLLQNCHLLLSWLKQLEKILQAMTSEWFGRLRGMHKRSPDLVHPTVRPPPCA